MLRKEVVIISGLFAALFVGNLANPPEPLENEQYIITISNGLVTAMSLLTSFAVFLTAHIYSNISDVKLQEKYKLRAFTYWFLLLMVIFVGVVLGYMLILSGDLVNAYRVFMSSFIIIIFIMADILLVGGDFYLIRYYT